MKKFYLICASFIAFWCNAQQVTHFEWFLDIDQGFGENHVQALSAGQNITADVTINIPAGTPAGYHKLYFRTKDSNGLWSHTVRRNINVVESQGELTVAQIEYFFGSDPQFGNASSYVVANPQANGTWVVEVPYPAGEYQFTDTLFFRARDQYGRWSHTTILNESGDLSTEVAVSANDLALYPNPATTTLFIHTNQTIQDVRLYDISGRKCATTFNQHAKTVDVSTIAPGIYMLCAQTTNGVLKTKFVKN